MPDHNYHDEDLFNPETRHEQSDIPIRPFWWAVIIFIVFSVLTWIVITFFFRGLATLERSQAAAPQSGIARPASADVPQNQPLLQPFPRKDGAGTEVAPTADTPVADLIKMRENEKQVLTSYGWVDRQQGKVHIPIDKAKELMAARLAVQGQTGAPAGSPVPGGQTLTSTTDPAAQTTTAPAPAVPTAMTPAATPTATPSGEGTAQ